MTTQQFDTIIVGAGPAGCVLAARLSASPNHDVLLIDAGPDYGSDPSDWPAELLDPIGPVLDTHSWGYTHRTDENERRLELPRGRVFGGCSAVNSCIWLHGSKADYDYWAEQGNSRWNYANLASHFAAAERDPLHVSREPGDHLVNVWRVQESTMSAVERALWDSAEEIGIPGTDDLNGSPVQAPAVGRTPKNIRRGMRLNAALTYLATARERVNLSLLPETQIDRVALEGSRAVGVITSDGTEIGGHEIILSAGAYGSPAILLRSGVGPVEHLREMEIPVRVDLPGVGENLMDHPYLAPYTSGYTSFFIAENAYPDRPIFIESMIKARSRQVSDEIDLHLYPRELLDRGTGRWVLGFGVSLQYSRSRGRVRLTSADPAAPLDIDHRYFDDPADLEALTDGVELADRLAATRPLSQLLSGAVHTRTPGTGREAIQRIIRAEVGTTFHPSSSCRMGPDTDPRSVVDQEGRVRGTKNLRVVDASIFPTGPRCNLHAPTVAVAERMAKIIVDQNLN